MSNTIREEFKQYTEDMVKRISKEIYEDDLKKLVTDYKINLDHYRRVVNNIEKLNCSNNQKVTEQVDGLNQMYTMIDGIYKEMNRALSLLDGGYKKVFQEYSKEVKKFDKTQQMEFQNSVNQLFDIQMTRMDQKLSEYRVKLMDLLQENYNCDVITEHSAIIQEATNVVGKALDALNGDYKQVFDSYKKDIQKLNEKERNKFITEMNHANDLKIEKLKDDIKQSHQESMNKTKLMKADIQRLVSQLEIEKEKMYNELDGVKQQIQSNTDAIHRLEESLNKENRKLLDYMMLMDHKIAYQQGQSEKILEVLTTKRKFKFWN